MIHHETNSVWYGSSDRSQMASLESFKGLSHPSEQLLKKLVFRMIIMHKSRETLIISTSKQMVSKKIWQDKNLIK